MSPRHVPLISALLLLPTSMSVAGCTSGAQGQSSPAPTSSAAAAGSSLPSGATEVWAAYEQLGTQDRSSLSEVQRAMFAICDLRQEVNSGGFDSYFRYWGGDTAPEALAALPEVLGSEWAHLLREAMRVLGASYPDNADARFDRLNEVDVANQLNELDLRFYDLEAATDADQLMTAYLTENDS